MTRTRIYGGQATAARVILGVGSLFALIEGVYILMLLFGADTANGFYQFIKSLAVPLALFFPGLFHVANPQVGILLDYGLAAIFWLVVARIIAGFVH